MKIMTLVLIVAMGLMVATPSLDAGVPDVREVIKMLDCTQNYFNVGLNPNVCWYVW